MAPILEQSHRALELIDSGWTFGRRGAQMSDGGDCRQIQQQSSWAEGDDDKK
jgi:hypothetical protein